MESTSDNGESEPYTYDWTFDNNQGEVVPGSSPNPLIDLPNPGIYDVILEVESTLTGCKDNLDSTAVVRVTGDTEFTVSKLKADESEVLEVGDIDLWNTEPFEPIV